MVDLKDKVALVTGAASGIGRASALAFARKGAAVLVADIDEEGGRETAALIQEAGGAAHFHRSDVTSDVEAAKMVAEAVRRFGRLDCSHNNAGSAGDPGLLHEYDPAMFRQVIEVNALGTFQCMKHELAYMASHGGGAIVNTSSIAGLGASPMMPAYVASKHAVNGLTKVAGLDYASRGIRVNAVCPGVVDTPMLRGWIDDNDELERSLIASEPIGRIARPEEVAETAVWLCSDDASFVTGTAIPVDGGMTSFVGGGSLE